MAREHGRVYAGNSNENGKDALGFSSEIRDRACRRYGKHPGGWKMCIKQVMWLQRATAASGNGRRRKRGSGEKEKKETTNPNPKTERCQAGGGGRFSERAKRRQSLQSVLPSGQGTAGVGALGGGFPCRGRAPGKGPAAAAKPGRGAERRRQPAVPAARHAGNPARPYGGRRGTRRAAPRRAALSGAPPRPPPRRRVTSPPARPAPF